jgi:uncharacterized protein YndB with AHSA1/START domain
MNAENNPAKNTIGHMLVVTREFNAPRERVWKAWTEPSQITQWLNMGDGMVAESARVDLRVGGKFRIQLKTADGEYFTAAGTYLEVRPFDRLVYTWDWEKDGAGTEFGELEGKETQLTVEFRAEGSRTKLVLTHEKLDTVERRDRHVTGWTRWVDSMAKFIEKT